MADGRKAIELDITDLQDKINFLQDSMSQQRFESAMYGVLRETARHMKAILKQDIPLQYVFSKSDIGKAVRSPELGFGASGGMTSCAVPIVGARYTVGGNHVPATGGWPGWNPPKYDVSFNIVTKAPSVLPEKLKNYGEQPAWINTAIKKKKKMNKVAFTRNGKSRLPIQPVKTIAIPQAITNRSEDDIRKDTLDYMANRLDHRITALLTFGK